jgi:hypothetical protein
MGRERNGLRLRTEAQGEHRKCQDGKPGRAQPASPLASARSLASGPATRNGIESGDPGRDLNRPLAYEWAVARLLPPCGGLALARLRRALALRSQRCLIVEQTLRRSDYPRAHDRRSTDGQDLARLEQQRA